MCEEKLHKGFMKPKSKKHNVRKLVPYVRQEKREKDSSSIIQKFFMLRSDFIITKEKKSYSLEENR